MNSCIPRPSNTSMCFELLVTFQQTLETKYQCTHHTHHILVACQQTLEKNINAHIIFQGFQANLHLENVDTLSENQPLILTRP